MVICNIENNFINNMNNSKIRWFIEKENRYKWIYHRIKRDILSKRTKYQNVEIFDTYNFGRVVILDSKIQSAETDEFIYHEILVHPAMITHPKPEYILILGGGEGATIREVLKHPTIKKVVMVDIDEEFVNICKKYLKKWHKDSFDNHKIELIFSDAKEYIKKTDELFDIIIGDLSDPVEKGPAQALYKKNFYTSLRTRLKSNGMFVTHSTEVCYNLGKVISVEVFKTLSEIFPITNFYYDFIPSFSTQWAFCIGSLKYNPKKISPEVIYKRLKNRNLDNLTYYDHEIHKRLFSLPKILKNLL
jgi:spermidine synthase